MFYTLPYSILTLNFVLIWNLTPTLIVALTLTLTLIFIPSPAQTSALHPNPTPNPETDRLFFFFPNFTSASNSLHIHCTLGEFSLPDTLRLWDSLFAAPLQDRSRWVEYFCVTMCISIRDRSVMNQSAIPSVSPSDRSCTHQSVRVRDMYTSLCSVEYDLLVAHRPTDLLAYPTTHILTPSSVVFWILILLVPSISFNHTLPRLLSMTYSRGLKTYPILIGTKAPLEWVIVVYITPIQSLCLLPKTSRIWIALS